MDHPKVDIICLVHNNLPITKKFQEHIFSNTSNFRLIFIDNASTDETPAYLKEGEEQNKWKVITSSTNLGVIGGRNLGAQNVEADYFLNIDNDQFVKRGWLEGLFELISKGYDIVGPEAWQLTPPQSGGAVIVNGSVAQDRSYFPFKHCKNPSDRFTYIGCGGMLIKKKVYDDIGLFDDRYSPAYYEDPDFCYDKKTHVYTDEGFMLLSEVTEKTAILTRDKNDVLVYQRPKWIIKKFDKKLLHFSNQQIDIMCSESQKLIVGYKRKPWGNDKGAFRSPDFVTAKHLAKKLKPRQTRYFIEKSAGVWIGTSQDVKIGLKKWKLRDFAVFMAWYLSKGNMCYGDKRRADRKDYSITICQTNPLNRVKYLDEIQSCIHKLGFSSRINSKGATFYCNWLTDYLSQFGKYYEKFIPQEIKNGTPDIMRSFLMTYLKGDGSIPKNGQKWSFSTSSSRMRNDLIELLIKCGRSFTCFYRQDGNLKIPTGIYYCRGVWQIQSYQNNIAYLPSPKTVLYNDYTYDINVDNHKILIMRDGKSCWSSNCFRSIKAGYKLGWKHDCPIIHLAHQTFNHQTLFQKNAQFVRSWSRFRQKWNGYFPEPISMAEHDGQMDP